MAQSDAAGSLIMVKWLACFIAKVLKNLPRNAES